ncbi:hypothetical protein [Winogradskyella sp.]|uniref:hypothetical protein n=1 Tax=Winogradskyella sp. TaxID=1883156 RepID=UPI003BAB8507
MKVHLKNDSILKNYNEETKPSEIFKEVCHLIGKYYSEKGWKYYGGRPKIKRESNDLIIEINFWSSHSNMAGSYVQLEILPYVSSKQLRKWIKEHEIGRNPTIYAPKTYSFRHNNVFGITESGLSSLLNEMDNFIEQHLNIENNDKFIEKVFQDLEESVRDNFACYFAMKKDKRMFDVIDYQNGFSIDKMTTDKLRKYYG